MVMPSRADEARREATATRVAGLHGLRISRDRCETIESFERRTLDAIASPLIAAARLARKDPAL